MRQEAAERTDKLDDADGHVRTCALTRARRTRDALIRFVLAPDGTVVPDLKERLPGRGLWLTAARDVVADAVKRKVFARSFKAEAKVSDELPATVERLLAEAALSALALANKAGAATFGNARVEEAIAGGRVLALIHAKEAAEDGCRKLDGKARAASDGRPVPAVRAFGTDELSLATGRTNVIHAALIQGGAAESVLTAASRLERYRKGKAAFVSKNGPETDTE
ncbi:MAG TPA: RNA-binding protein [Methyloceanibacter sp.]|nr:RNA-binding protein [Methyloceanibacter sp.]